MKARRSAELFVSVRKGDWQRVQTLVDAGADVNTYGAHKVSAVMLAASKGNAGVCSMLLAKRAVPDAQDENHKRTALMFACMSSVSNVTDVLQSLLDGNASVDLQDIDGHSALMLAAKAKNADAALFLLERGANVSLLAQTGTFDHEAMGLRSNATRQFLKNATLSPINPIDNFMKNHRRLEEQAFLSYQEELGTHDDDPLSWQSSRDWIASMGEGMLERSTSPVVDENIVDGIPKISFSNLIDNASEQGSELPSAAASEMGSQDEDWAFLDEMFLSAVAPLRPQDLAKPLPELEIRRRLIAQSERIRGVIRRSGGSRDSALTIAARGGDAHICELLLRFGADSNIPDGNNESALVAAARCGHVEACRVLLTCHPSHSTHDAALQAAEKAGSEAVARVLRGYKVLGL